MALLVYMEGTQDLLAASKMDGRRGRGNGPSKMAGSGESRERGAGSGESGGELGTGSWEDARVYLIKIAIAISQVSGWCRIAGGCISKNCWWWLTEQLEIRSHLLRMASMKREFWG